jgi:hypothetical protein
MAENNAAFFYFPDLTVAAEGTFRLDYTLHESQQRQVAHLSLLSMILIFR